MLQRWDESELLKIDCLKLIMCKEERDVLMRAYRFRFYPTVEQEKMLLSWLERCRLLYNHALAERRDHYKITGHGLSYEDQANMHPTYKEEHPEYLALHSQVLQNVLMRLDRAFMNFFEGRARYPRFKRYGEYRSITYPQIRPEDVGRRSVILSKIGRVRIVKDRHIILSGVSAALKAEPHRT